MERKRGPNKEQEERESLGQLGCFFACAVSSTRTAYYGVDFLPSTPCSRNSSKTSRKHRRVGSPTAEKRHLPRANFLPPPPAAHTMPVTTSPLRSISESSSDLGGCQGRRRAQTADEGGGGSRRQAFAKGSAGANAQVGSHQKALTFFLATQGPESGQCAVSSPDARDLAV